MRHIFGFVDNYSKGPFGMRDTLQLIRKDENDALFRTAAAGAGKVKLAKLAWSVPIGQPNNVRKVNYTRVLPRIMSFPYRFVCANVKHSLYLRQDLLYGKSRWVPRWVLVGLQTDRSGNQ